MRFIQWVAFEPYTMFSMRDSTNKTKNKKTHIVIEWDVSFSPFVRSYTFVCSFVRYQYKIHGIYFIVKDCTTVYYWHRCETERQPDSIANTTEWDPNVNTIFHLPSEFIFAVVWFTYHLLLVVRSVFRRPFTRKHSSVHVLHRNLLAISNWEKKFGLKIHKQQQHQ